MSNVAPIGLSGMVAAVQRLDLSARYAANASSAAPRPAGPTSVALSSAPLAGRDGMVAVVNVDFAGESAEQLLARYQLALQDLIARLYRQPIKSLIDITA
jgi:flagellar basal body rod protein FlgC